MSVAIISGRWHKVLICNTTMTAFGDVFYDEEDVESFLEWLPRDAREYSEKELSKKVQKWREMNDAEVS